MKHLHRVVNWEKADNWTRLKTNGRRVQASPGLPYLSAPGRGQSRPPPTLRHNEFPSSDDAITIWKSTEEKMFMYKALPHSVSLEQLGNSDFPSRFFAKPSQRATASLNLITNKKCKLIPSAGKLLSINCQSVSRKRRWQSTLLCLSHYETEVNFNKSLGCPFILF